jgi:serine/threonine protein kinase
MCGSPAYVAPEIYENDDKGYDQQCDLWSAGVVIYAILGGYCPFEGGPFELPHLICAGDYRFHEKYWKDISDPSKDLIRHLLVVNPKERHTAVKALDVEWMRRRHVKRFGSDPKELKEMLSRKERLTEKMNQSMRLGEGKNVEDMFVPEIQWKRVPSSGPGSLLSSAPERRRSSYTSNGGADDDSESSLGDMPFFGQSPKAKKDSIARFNYSMNHIYNDLIADELEPIDGLPMMWLDNFPRVMRREVKASDRRSDLDQIKEERISSRSLTHSRHSSEG